MWDGDIKHIKHVISNFLSRASVEWGDPGCSNPWKKTGEQQLWYLVLAYDGTDFAGWQRQAEGVRTLQGEVEKALSLVFRAEIRTVGASRTDTGVHALGQVCHFEAPAAWGDGTSAGHGALEPEVALRRLRLTLPTSLFARLLGRVESGFHSRLSAVRKRYVYRLSVTSDVLPFEARRSWLCGALDLTATSEAVNALSGQEMDYSAFTTGENEPEYHGSVVKTVDLEMRILPGQVFIEASCERFLYKMVRRIVGALVEVGKGRLKAESIAPANRCGRKHGQRNEAPFLAASRAARALRAGVMEGRQKERDEERQALKSCRDILLGPRTPDQGTGETTRGARGVVGEGAKQRQFRLDTDEPGISETLSKLAREVREADQSASIRNMDFQSKCEAHDVEMKLLDRERLTMPLDITSLPLEELRSTQIRRWRLQGPKLQRHHLREIERCALASDQDLEVTLKKRSLAPLSRGTSR
ncbi:unnamed protein product [Effrenium voratum]|nr:unnamed protein product [Effrenium voratum]